MTEIDAVMALMSASFDPHYREAWTRRQVEDSLMLPTTYVLLADRTGTFDGEPQDAVGFVMARHVIDEVELLLIAVHPEMRGQGYGRALLREFFASARERSASRVFLEMRANNPAEALYRSQGFEQIGLRKAYYRTVTGHPLDAMTFARDV